VNELADYTIYDALQNAAEAWSMVSSQTIANCWKKTGILPPNDKIEEFFDDASSVFSDRYEIIHYFLKYFKIFLLTKFFF